MSIRFLLFRGKWENEGAFSALETSESILIFSVGQDYALKDISAQQIGRDYLKEKKEKIKGIFLTNTSFRNIGLLENVCQDLGENIPIYTSYHSKIILSTSFPKLKNKIIILEQQIRENGREIGEFSISCLPINSYLLGNQGIACHYLDYSFYFLEDFCFSSLLNNELFFQKSFFSKLINFLGQKKTNSYLVTSCQNMSWYNNNSLFLAKKLLPTPILCNDNLFFIFYEFDWLHIFELIELTRLWKKKIIIINPSFANTLKKILVNNESLRRTITVFGEHHNNEKKDNSSNIYLLVANPDNILDLVDYYLQKISFSNKQQLHFILGTPPVMGGEARLARILDYLHNQSSKITNLSKKEYLKLGISFTDLQILINLFQPTNTIILNYSYKSSKFFSYLSGNFLFLDNNHFWDTSNKKLTPFSSNNRTVINLEEKLVEQRHKLSESGMLIVCLTAEWKEEKICLRNIILEKIAIVSLVSNKKLEEKIQKWWEQKLVYDLTKKDPIKNIKKAIERRLNNLIRRFTDSEYGVEVEEITTLIFIQ